MRMARSTPAQNPRGLASNNLSCGLWTRGSVRPVLPIASLLGYSPSASDDRPRTRPQAGKSQAETPFPMRFPTIVFCAALMLSGCVHDQDKGLCPSAAALVSTSSLTVFKTGTQPDPSNEVYTAYLVDVSGGCDFNKDRNTTDSKVVLHFRAKR